MTPVPPAADMDRVVGFVREYIAADLEAERAGGVDNDEYLRRLQALKAFHDKGVGPGQPLVLSDELSQAEREQLAMQASKLRPRPFFKLKRWKHREQGILYQAYLGSSTPSKKKGYYESVLVKDVGGTLAIIARHSVCGACFATGLHAGKRCPDCEAPGWRYVEGLNLTSFGEPEVTLRFEAPTNTTFLPEYESD